VVKTCGQSDFSSSFSKKVKSPETRLFQGFFDDFEKKYSVLQIQCPE
jgi:hypothetical protein